ncbi:MAG: bidirectional hydrogenase complex protein HoxE [Cyanobacteria bacterium REEB67]|nr:bidirectional hydrogenase complex protein HoxE [Cyanobacteria bacterium REEB67]
MLETSNLAKTTGSRSKVVEPPTDDKRWRLVIATMRRHGYAQSALIETLHTVQSCFGYLDEAGMLFVARSLKVSPSKVYGVATFYSLFRLKPQGKHTCVICLGTACYIKGAAKLLDAVESTCGLKVGETTADNQISLLEARCLGACGIAPAAILDGQVCGKLEAAELKEKLEKWHLNL